MLQKNNRTQGRTEDRFGNRPTRPDHQPMRNEVFDEALRDYSFLSGTHHLSP